MGKEQRSEPFGQDLCSPLQEYQYNTNLKGNDRHGKTFVPVDDVRRLRNLTQEIQNMENAGIDIFHIDVMNGEFVPNFGMGLQNIEFILKHARKPVDTHLMIVNPGDYVDKFASMNQNYLYPS